MTYLDMYFVDGRDGMAVWGSCDKLRNGRTCTTIISTNEGIPFILNPITDPVVLMGKEIYKEWESCIIGAVL